jgi:hypothetical protein
VGDKNFADMKDKISTSGPTKIDWKTEAKKTHLKLPQAKAAAPTAAAGKKEEPKAAAGAKEAPKADAAKAAAPAPAAAAPAKDAPKLLRLPSLPLPLKLPTSQ